MTPIYHYDVLNLLFWEIVHLTPFTVVTGLEVKEDLVTATVCAINFLFLVLQ